MLEHEPDVSKEEDESDDSGLLYKATRAVVETVKLIAGLF